MKVFKNFFVVGLFAFLITFNLNFANAGSSLKINNNTTKTIVHLYCTADTSDWGRERLGNDILKPGYSFTIRTAPVTTHRYVHLVFGVYVRGTLKFKSLENIDLNKISYINLDGNWL